MIQFVEVKKVYPGDIVALDNVSFTIEPQEFTFIVGPSGAGKSTLIRLLVRQELPTMGDIIFEDTDILSIPTPLLPIYRRQLGIVFQDLKLILSKTVQENIEFALEIAGKSSDEIAETSHYLLDVVNLSGRSHLFPAELSGGEKQKVAIARALANSPKVFIADEPTGNLDSETAFEILDILKTINSLGTTVLVISHDKNLVESVEGRTIELRAGKVVKDTGKKQIKKKEPKTFLGNFKKETREVLKSIGVGNLEELLAKTEKELSKVGLSTSQIEEIDSVVSKLLKK